MNRNSHLTVDELIREQAALLILIEAYENGRVLNATKGSTDESIRIASDRIREISSQITKR